MRQNDLDAQRKYFQTDSLRPFEKRVELLKKLKAELRTFESRIIAALHQDMGKSALEAYSSEIAFLHAEIDHTLKHLKKWMKPEAKRTPLFLQFSNSRVVYEPKGLILIIGPWNYPFQLLIGPLIGAIAAGNCVVLKPSELAKATEALVINFIRATFPEEICQVVTGGVAETQELLKQKFDHIFFTGSIPVGKVVMEAASKHLTPVTLELGGKSPCVVDETVDLAISARRIAWAKFYNVGQTCVAPDYLLVKSTVASAFLKELQKAIDSMYGRDPMMSPDYGRIINERNFDRLVRYLDDAKEIMGGASDRSKLYIEPTILPNAHLGMSAMSDEIFGPILPVIVWNDKEEAFKVIAQHSHPLACYLFTNDQHFEKEFIERIPFGGGCINNAIAHLANPDLPFGGIGQSGMGAYHGKDSFLTFSHRKSILKSRLRPDFEFKYPPYTDERVSLIRRLLT